MACNVFGTPVTDATLKGMTEYHDKVSILAADRARVALNMRNAEGKDTDARTFVDKVQDNVVRKGVKCLIYNATGGPLKLVAAYEYVGCVSESPFPTYLENGQWGAFVHEKTNDSTQSITAVVFEATEDDPAQWVFGWYQTNNEKSKCYSEFRSKGYYTMGSESEDLRNHIESSTFIHESQKKTGEAIFASIGNTATPIFEAILTRTASSS